MNIKDRDEKVRLLLKEMREKLSEATPRAQTEIICLSRMVDTLMETPVSGLLKASVDLAHFDCLRGGIP